MARAPRTRVPLKYRLPNAPATFVGRDSELTWLEAALGRGPVVGVTGPAGIGKSALVLRLLTERFPDRVPKTVYLGVRPGEPTDQVRLDLVKVLARAARKTVDLAEVAIDPETLTEAIIDLAEDAELVVVLDDVHHADTTEMNEMLTMLVSYARQSRWLVTSRMEIGAPRLSGQTLPVGAMKEADLISLAHALQPEQQDAHIHDAVVAASGSPWLLSQYVVTGAAGVTLSRERLLDNLPRDVEPFLRVLAILQAPFDLETLSQLAAVPAETSLDALERRGLLIRSDAGIRLHDVATGLLFSGEASRVEDHELRVRAAAVLESSGVPESVVEAARLLLTAGAMDSLAALLDGHAETLFAEAQAPRLWTVIGELRDPRIVSHQLRCAAELGNPTALGAVRPANDPEPEDTLAWAQAVYAKGDVERAQSLASELRLEAEEASDAELTVEGALLRARCLLHDDQPELAVRELQGVDAEGAGLSLRRDALLVRCQARSAGSDVDVGIASLRRRGETALGEHADALHDLSQALYSLGRFDAAVASTGLLLSTPHGERTSLLVTRKALLLRARLRMEGGELRESAELIASLRPYVRTTSLLRPTVSELDIQRRIIVGDMAGLEAELEGTLREAARIDRALVRRLEALRERLAMCRGHAPGPGEAAEVDPTARSAGSEDLQYLRARRRVRHGYEVEADVDLTSPDALMLHADAALIAGEAELAVAHAQQARLLAERRGRAPLRAEAQLCLIDALTVAGRREEVITRANELLDLSRGLDSARLRLSAELFQASESPATLERVAQYGEVAPIAARRARALLGGKPVLDRVDQRVVAALVERAGATTIETVRGDTTGEWRTAWGMDELMKGVWLPDGRVVDLSRKALLFRLLGELVSRGRATKEELVLSVWEERTYHPGRHDPRVHMSIRKLRELIEDDPGTPARLVTTDDGYGIAGTVRRLVLG